MWRRDHQMHVQQRTIDKIKLTPRAFVAMMDFILFFWKRELLLISKWYIKVIHRFEIFPASAKKHTAYKSLTKPDKLMTVNPKTKQPHMC